MSWLMLLSMSIDESVLNLSRASVLHTNKTCRSIVASVRSSFELRRGKSVSVSLYLAQR